MLSFSIIYPVLSLWLCRETLSRTLNYLCITANCVYIFFAAQNIREICLNCNNSSENKLNNCAAVKTSKFLGLNCFLLSWNAPDFSINIACLCESLSLYVLVYVCVCLCMCLCICFVCVCATGSQCKHGLDEILCRIAEIIFTSSCCKILSKVHTDTHTWHMYTCVCISMCQKYNCYLCLIKANILNNLAAVEASRVRYGNIGRKNSAIWPKPILFVFQSTMTIR